MTENAYTERKWELFNGWQGAFPRFPKVGINRKQKLMRLVAEHDGITLEEARVVVERMAEKYA